MSANRAAVIASVGMFLVGLACIVFAQKIGVGFCRLGKSIWKITTFGLTDMHWFYREAKAPFTGSYPPQLNPASTPSAPLNPSDAIPFRDFSKNLFRQPV
jgi:hypothetical protein